MYAAAAPAPVVAPQRGGLAASGPVLAICCLLLVLFVIAATIVLALIPVYVERDITANQFSTPHTFKMEPADASGKRATIEFNGECDWNAATLVGLSRALEVGAGFPTDSFDISAGRSTAQSAGRRRRGFGSLSKRANGRPDGYCPFRCNKKRSSRCGNKNFVKNIKPFFITVQITCANGTAAATGSITLYVTIIEGLFTVPPFSGSSSSTNRLSG